METLAKFNESEIINSIREPARRVIELRRKAAVLRAEVDKIKRSVLAEMQLKDEDGNIVLNPDVSWTIEPEEDLLLFHAKLQKIVREKIPGANELPEDHCPALSAEFDLLAAENDLLRAICPIMGTDPEQVMVAKSDLRKKFVDITLELV
jgi:hypothetical protein